MRRQNPTTWTTASSAALTAFTLATVLATTASVSGADIYETSLSHRHISGGSWTDIVFESSAPFVDHPEFTSGSDSGDWWDLSGLSTSTGGELSVASDFYMWAGGSGNHGREAWLSSYWGSSLPVTDLVFSLIDDPHAGGQAVVRLDLNLFIAWSDTGTRHPECDLRPGEVKEIIADSAAAGGTTAIRITADVPQGWQTITGPEFVVDLTEPYSWLTHLVGRTVVNMGNPGDCATSPISLELILRLGPLNEDGTIGPVFDLPEGITANAASIGLVDNYFNGVVRPCAEDLSGSGAVDFGDILAILAAWGPCGGCPEDLDESGVVDFGDILAVLSSWGPCP